MYTQLMEEVNPEDDALLFADVVDLLRQYHTELEGHPYLEHFEYLFKRWIPERRKHVYLNGQNVHVFAGSSMQVAMHIMINHPCHYYRPFDHPFFDVIENCEPVIYTEGKVQVPIFLPSLFASIFDYILKHEHRDTLVQRLIEEMDESRDMCIMGHFTRLVNSINGFDDYDIVLDDYEATKARVFHQFNQHLDLLELETLTTQISTLVNQNTFGDVEPSIMVRILHDYTKHPWSVVGGRFVARI